MGVGISASRESDLVNNQEITILVVEDEVLTRTIIGRTLTRSHYAILEATSAEEGLALLESREVDLVLLDIMLPGMDGFEMCRRIRARWPATAIIMLTHMGAHQDAVRGLLAGADDYMVKPHDPEELLARAGAVLRRTMERAIEPSQVAFRNLKIEYHTQKCFKDGRDLNLTPKEFVLLATLCTLSGKPVSRSRLASEVWGGHHFISSKSLDVYVRRLRQKVEDDPAEPTLIRTVRGYGYVFE